MYLHKKRVQHSTWKVLGSSETYGEMHTLMEMVKKNLEKAFVLIMLSIKHQGFE
jgi:hypothetical protein